MSGYTKGPWVITTNTNGEVCTVHGVTNQPTEDGEGQRWVYVTPEKNDKWFERTDEEQMSNAHLIAAAPDMYEALKEMVSELNAFVATSGIDIKDPKHKNGTWYRRREAAITAISKAEGK